MGDEIRIAMMMGWFAIALLAMFVGRLVYDLIKARRVRREVEREAKC